MGYESGALWQQTHDCVGNKQRLNAKADSMVPTHNTWHLRVCHGSARVIAYQKWQSVWSGMSTADPVGVICSAAVWQWTGNFSATQRGACCSTARAHARTHTHRRFNRPLFKPRRWTKRVRLNTTSCLNHKGVRISWRWEQQVAPKRRNVTAHNIHTRYNRLSPEPDNALLKRMWTKWAIITRDRQCRSTWRRL